jgi:hypothetical protein
MPGKVHDTFPGNNEHILAGNHLVAIPAETFSKKPLNSVSDNRISYLRTNGYAEPGLSSIIQSGDYQEMGGVDLCPPTRQAQKLWPFSQTGLFRKVLSVPRQHSRFLGARPLARYDNRQPLSPLGSPSFQHFTSAGRLHPNEEAVCSFSSYIARLIGPFHTSSTPLGRLDSQEFISIIDY